MINVNDIMVIIKMCNYINNTHHLFGGDHVSHSRIKNDDHNK